MCPIIILIIRALLPCFTYRGIRFFNNISYNDFIYMSEAQSGSNIDLSDESSVRTSLEKYSPWLKETTYAVDDFIAAYDTLQKPEFRPIVDSIHKVHIAYKDYIDARVRNGLALPPGSTVPANHNYLIDHDLFEPTATQSKDETEELNEPLLRIKTESDKFSAIFESSTGLPIQVRPYSKEIYREEKNRAAFGTDKSKPILCLQPGFENNIGELAHEAVAWYYMTDGFNRNAFPKQMTEIWEAKTKISPAASVVEAILENPQVLSKVVEGV